MTSMEAREQLSLYLV
uniref:Uncharacterized protein n=1 Tax=Rhizophora mucronata TaxID=61149 RepID=A0A2P2PXV8_RHIMU